MAGDAVAGKGRHRTVGRDSADGIVAGIGDIEIAAGTKRNRGGRAETRDLARTIDEARPGPGKRRHPSVRQDRANAIGVAAFGNEDGSVLRDRDAERIGETGAVRRTIDPAGDAVAGDDANLRRPVPVELGFGAVPLPPREGRGDERRAKQRHERNGQRPLHFLDGRPPASANVRPPASVNDRPAAWRNAGTVSPDMRYLWILRGFSAWRPRIGCSPCRIPPSSCGSSD